MKPGSRAWKKDVLLGAAERIDKHRGHGSFNHACCWAIERSGEFLKGTFLDVYGLRLDFVEFFDKPFFELWWDGIPNDITQQGRVIALLLFRESL